MSGPPGDEADFPRIAPPDDLRARVLAVGVPAPFTILRADQGFWLAVSPGTRVRTLFRDSRDRGMTRLVELDDAVVVPPPEIPGWVTYVLLRGRLDERDGPPLRVGDVAGGGGGTARGVTCLLEFVTTGTPGSAPRSIGEGSRWIQVGEGLRASPLDLGVGQRATWFDAAPAATLDAHAHDGLEELYVVEGSCVVEGEVLQCGDYHRALPGTHHGLTVAGGDGCRVLCMERTL